MSHTRINPLLCLLGCIALMTTAAQAAEYSATVEYAAPLKLSTTVSGRVTSVKVEPGASVDKGQLLATIDPRPFQAAKKRAEAELIRLKNAATLAQRDYGQAQELYDRTVLSNTELQDAELRAADARALLQRGEAELLQAKLNLEYSQIRAPIAGQVLAVNVQPGQTVINNLQATPMITLIDPRHLKATVTLETQAPGSARLGETATIKTNHGSFSGTVSSHQVNAEKTLMGITFKPDHPIAAGTTVTVEIP
ncbi:MAG: efflux RND transporter periplasmic adaptor subunit [Thiotrichales bacterium]